MEYTVSEDKTHCQTDIITIQFGCYMCSHSAMQFHVINNVQFHGCLSNNTTKIS